MTDSLEPGLRRRPRRADVDPVTGLSGRRSLMNHFDSLGPAREPWAFLIAEVMNFREAIAELGPWGEGELLRQIGRRLLSFGDEYDLVARIGCEEFAVVSAGVADDLHGRRVAEALVEVLVEDGYSVAGHGVRLDAVAAVVVHTLGEDPQETFVRADRALHDERERWRQAKKAVRPQGHTPDDGHT